MTKDWKEIHTRLTTSGSHDTTSKEYLKTIKGPIRIFVGDGPGFGDQNLGLNFHDQLRYQEFFRTIEFIAPNNGINSPLLRLLKLFNAERLFKKDTLTITYDGYKIRFYEANYFNSQLPVLPEVELALFPGFLKFLQYSYSTSHFNYQFEYRLTQVAKAKRAIQFDPFLHMESDDAPGFIMQLKNQRPVKNFASNVLGFRTHPPTLEKVNAQLQIMEKTRPTVAGEIKKIIHLISSKQVQNFPIYAIHHLKGQAPINSLANFAIGGSMVCNRINSPLLLTVLSPFTDKSWQNFQHMLVKHSQINISDSSITPFPKLLIKSLKNLGRQIEFVDMTANQILPAIQENSTIIIRMPHLPNSIFAEIIRTSLLPTVYEGVNTARLLEDMGLWGLTCQKMFEYELVVNKFRSRIEIARIPAADAHAIPKELLQLGLSYCSTETDFLTLWQDPVTTPAHNVSKAIEFTQNNKRLLPSPKDSRLDYGLETVSNASHCEEVFDPQQCDFVTYPIQSRLGFFTRGIAKGFGYGCLSEVSSQVAQRNFQKKPRDADKIGSFIQLFAQLIFEADWSQMHRGQEAFRQLPWMALSVLMVSIMLAPVINPGDFNALMFLAVIAPKAVTADLQTSGFLLATLVFSHMAFQLGKQTTTKFSNGLFGKAFKAEPAPDRIKTETTGFAKTIS